MEKLHGRGTVRSIEKRYDFRTTKSLGQNFITESWVIDRIVEGSGIGPRDLVIEIGPGLGVVTAGAAKAAGKVVAIEIDKKLIPILQETVGGHPNVSIINADVLDVDMKALIEKERTLPDGSDAECVRIVGNLPYYITSPILMKLLEHPLPAESITVMIQKEVAERIAAKPGTKIYGNLSVAIQYYCDIEYMGAIPAEVFLPQPKVDSAILHLNIRKQHKVELISEAVFFEVIKSGFGQRRKTLNNSLVGVRGNDKYVISSVLAECGIEPQRRAETLTIEEFATLANCIAKLSPQQ